MLTSSSIFLAPLARPLLSEAARKRLTEMGLSSIRQSWYASGRRCPAMLSLSMKDTERMGVKALFGSIFHMMFSDPEVTNSNHRNPDFYLELFRRQRQLDSTTKYYQGPQQVTWENVKAWARMFASPDYLTMSLGELAYRLYEQLGMQGHIVEAAEELLVYTDGKWSKYPIKFTGTLDLRTRFMGGRCIWDVKTTGLWDVYLENSNSGIKAQSVEPQELRYHSQLRHYCWQLHKMTGIKAQFQGLLLPTNLVPYFKGDKQGQIRGNPIAIAPSLGDLGNRSYETDFIKFFESFTRPGGDYRAYPSTFGKIDCPTCPHFQACQGDLTSSSQAAELGGGQYDYLRSQA